jgi:predicted alpha-1,2-mannosidase
MLDRRARRLLVVAWSAILIGAAALPAGARAQTSFSSSFEPADPQPAWTSTVDTGAKRASGVTGPKRTGIPGNVTDKVVAVTASDENPPDEVKENLVDGSSQSKWLTFHSTGWAAFTLSEPIAVVRYALTSANDAADRDPKDWTLSGSDDGQAWTELDHQTGQDFADRFQTKEYAVANTHAYLHYRLDVTANHGDDIVQLAELQLSNGDTTPPPPSDMTAKIGGGPRGGYNAKSGVGFTGLKALQYAGAHTATGRGFSYDEVFDVDVRVTRATALSYLIYPDFEEDDLSYPSTYAAVDLVFTDGTYLSDLGAIDQHGAALSPQGQGASKTLYTNQWNFIRSRIGAVAAGKTVDRILVAYDNPHGPADFGGWVDDVKLDGHPPQRDRSHPSDWVLTNRGTNSSGSFSRGNNIPATAVPNGFNFWVPVTDAGTDSWLYQYQKANNADNLPTLQAFSASHEPSPWMGDRQTFQVMPSAASATPDTSREGRALPFRHANEQASPDHYSVAFENGIRTEIAPTDHAAMFRFSFPDDHANLVFDNINDQAAVTIDRANGVVSGWSDVRSGLSAGATRLFVYATFDKPITASATSAQQTGYAMFDTSGGRTVTMRIATSLISLDQARKNLALEISPTDTFAQLRERARRAWDKRLGAIDVKSATDDQRTTLYSNLYRLSLYPNSAFENTGSARAPVYAHALQSSTSTPPSTPTQTGAKLVPGKVYVNNGFWDTYRTAWSAYSLLAPRMAGELVDGFVQQYRDGGWIARWSSPGYANLMTGTSSDVAFADAFVKGVPGLDAADTYDAALKNATVAPPGDDPNDTSVGRKGLIRSIFRGYTSTDVPEGVSWALEGYINDYGIANMAGAMARGHHVGRAEGRRLREEHDYFLGRARNYVNMFDPATGFFQGRKTDGSFLSPPEAFDPREWGHQHDYTETDGWGFAFHAPQDGQGLANLYGGRAGLAAKLDAFFSMPETAKNVGSYGGTIHEMIEARDVRMGQWGFSNQVSHHIPYMYDYAGQPYKTQAKVREALRRMYLGSEIGQGYAGDEDNGETSAWYLFGALGFYPLQVGSPYYAIGSPLFREATLHLENGRDLVVRARHNSQENVYVQGLTLNGRRIDRAYLAHRELARGGVLTFEMGPRPSRWATGRHAAPPSITHGDQAPLPLRDATGDDRGTATGSADVAALFDDTSGTRATLAGARPWVQYRFNHDERQAIRFYTLTSGDGPASADPRSWVVKGSNDGQHWKVLDARRGETFRWRSQTRPFELHHARDYAQYRIEFGGATTLAEVELLTTRRYVPPTLSASLDAGTATAGSTVPVRVSVENTGTAPDSGDVVLTGPQGWGIAPATAHFGPVAPGASATVTFQLSVPADAAPGSFPLTAAVNSPLAEVHARGAAQVIGDTIEFTPGTAAEEPWLLDAGGSQLDGDVFDGRARFADGGSHFDYRFALPDAVTGGTLTLDVGNEFLVQVSTDGTSWRTVLEQQEPEHDLGNRAERPLDLNALRGDGHTVFVRVADSHPQDGWGGWLARVRLELQTG